MAFYWHILQSHGEFVLPSKRTADTIIDTSLAMLGGLGIAISHHVSKAYGDRDYSLVRLYTWSTVRFVVIAVASIGMLIILTGESVVSAFFSDDYRVVKMTCTFLIIGVLNDMSALAMNIVSTSLKAVQQYRIFMVSGVVSNVLFAGAAFLGKPPKLYPSHRDDPCMFLVYPDVNSQLVFLLT
jgi:Na+-driven multidrug efflux pump